jgi:hypothetical protein
MSDVKKDGQATVEAAPAGTIEAIKAMSIEELQGVRGDLCIVDALPDQEARESIEGEFERLKFEGVKGAALRGIVRESVADPVQIRFESTMQEIVGLDGLDAEDKERACEALGVAAEKYGVDLKIPTFEKVEDPGTEETEEQKAAREADAEKAKQAQGEEPVDVAAAVEAGKTELREEIEDGKRLTRAIESLAVIPEVDKELRRRLEPRVEARSLNGEKAINAAVKEEHESLSRAAEALQPSFEGAGETTGDGEGTESAQGSKTQAANVSLGAAYGAPSERK